MKLGRPLKGSTRRNPITIYAPEETLKKIEEYIDQREAETGKSYSRSDFYQEAALSYLKKEEGEKTIPSIQEENGMHDLLIDPSLPECEHFSWQRSPVPCPPLRPTAYQAYQNRTRRTKKQTDEE